MPNILGQLGEAVVLLRADGKSLNEDLKKQRAELEGRLDTISRGLSATGLGLTATVTAPIIAMGVAATAAALKMDEAFDTIRVETGATGKALEGLHEDFKEVLVDVPQSAEEVAAAISLINTRTGLAGESLQEFTTQLLDMSRMTKTDVVANVDAATGAFNGWAIATENQGDALDYVFKVSQATGASVTELLQMVAREQGVFQSLNLDFEESVAILGQMNKVGIESTQAISALRFAVKAFAEANIPAREGLKQTFDLIKNADSEIEATGLAMEVFGTRSGPAFAIAVRQGRIGYEELMASVKGSTDTIASVRAETDGFAEAWPRLKNQALVALEPIGTKILQLGERAIPVLVKFGNVVIGLTEWFADLPGPIQLAGFAVLGLAAAAGPALIVAGQLVGSWRTVITVMNAVRTSSLLTSRSLTTVAATAGRVIVPLGILAAGAKFAKDAFTGAFESTQKMSEALEFAKNKLRGMSDEEAVLAARATVAARAQEEQADSAGDLDAIMADLDDQIAHLSDTQVDANISIEDFKDQIEGVASATDEFENRIRSMTNELTGGAITEGRIYEEVLRRIGGTQALTNEEVENFNDVLADAIEKMQRMGMTAEPAFAQVYNAWVQTAERMVSDSVGGRFDPAASGMGLGRTTLDNFRRQREVLDAISGPLEILQNFPIRVTDIGAPPSVLQQFGREVMSAFGEFTQDLGPVILQALTGGGSVSRSIGGLAGQRIGQALTNTFGQTLSRTLGPTIGGAIGSILPGIGTLFGSFIGQGLGRLGQWVGNMFGNQTRGAREDFAAQLGFGNLGQLYDDLRALGAEGERLAHIGLNVIGRNDQEGNERWMRDVMQFYDDVEAKKMKALQDEMDARDRLQATIEKYGFTIEELGPKWREQKLAEMAQELIEDYTILTASGIDVDTVIRRMGDSIQEFVDLAKKTGTEVPESMRPMLQKMIEMGLLTDENGELITDLESSGIQFSQTMTQGFQSVVDKLDELIRKITGDLTDGIENIPNPTVTVDVEYRPTKRGLQPVPMNEEEAYYAEEYPQLSGGGLANWGAGTLAVLHGPEAVIPLDRLEDMVNASGASLNPVDIAEAFRAVGLDRPNVTIAPRFDGALAREMHDFARILIPMIIQVLRDDGTLNRSMAGTIGVEQDG